MPVDYRYDPFQDVLNAVTISDEMHTIPSVSPFSIRLGEVPLKETPSSINLTIDGVAAEEVSSAPAAGQFWPDYSTGADGDDTWNTGTILFNSADAGKTVVVTYEGTGNLVDSSRRTFVFTTSGVITVPAWATHAIISGCGGGGPGGNTSGNNAYAAGGGGGAGGCCINYLIEITPGGIYTITIGAAGTSGGGGTTSLGNLLSLNGGGVGGTGSSNARDTGGGGGAGGAISGGGIAAPGLAGEKGISTSGGRGGRGNNGMFGRGGASNKAASGYGAGGGGRFGVNLGRMAGSPGILMIRWARL